MLVDVKKLRVHIELADFKMLLFIRLSIIIRTYFLGKKAEKLELEMVFFVFECGRGPEVKEFRQTPET